MEESSSAVWKWESMPSSQVGMDCRSMEDAQGDSRPGPSSRVPEASALQYERCRSG